MICAVFKPYGLAAKTFRFDELRCQPGKEKRLIEAVVKEMGNYDLVVGHNLIRFDLNYIKSRAVLFDVNIPRHPLVYDTLAAFRRCGFLTRANAFGKPTASLAMVADFLGIKQEKTGIYPREHWKIVWERGEEQKTVLDKLVYHCAADVRMTEEVYKRLLQYDQNPQIKRMR